MMQAWEEESGEINHPFANRMAAIALVNQNLAIAGLFGSFSVLLASVEVRLHVGRELSTLAIPAVNLACAICGPIVGVLASRYSLKLIMLIGSILGVAGFAVLGAVANFPAYLLAYGLLLGPAMSIGTVLPAALVTRWFTVNRGKALGVIAMPIAISVVPLATTWTLAKYGLTATYLGLAAIGLISVVANLFIVDRPPGGRLAAASIGTAEADPVAASDGSTVKRLLLAPRFWARSFAYAVSAGGAVMLGAHVVPLGTSWGFSLAQSATLLSIQLLSGILGTILFGWVVDRLGGVRTLALLMIDDAILWALLSLQPPFAVTAVLMGLFGLHCAGIVPVFGIALSEGFGRENFARSFGLANLVTLPFSVASVPAAAAAFIATGSYSSALIGGAVLFLLVFVFVLLTRREQHEDKPLAFAQTPDAEVYPVVS